MVRAPCCEKMGLKKGPWTRDEDQVLIDYVTLYGHGNWRALPKQAGLLRCGKSCRLRWTNYLRPDIKRGNFTREEEDTIINLHGLLGNRWSAIAARLPGRTDNEIKNVWHTHLKKRLKHLGLDHDTPKSKKKPTLKMPKSENIIISVDEEEEDDNDKDNNNNDDEDEKESKGNYNQQNSPQHSSGTDISSSVVTTSEYSGDNTCMEEGTDKMLDNFPELDEDFWSEVFSSGGGDNSSSETTRNFQVENGDTQIVFQCQQNNVIPLEMSGHGCNISSNVHDGMDFFWYDIFTRAGEEFA